MLAPAAPAQEYAKARYEGAEKLVPDLEKLATWCASVGLNRERDRTYANILELQADHALARKALMYSRQPDGSWTQSSSYKEPKNPSDKQLPAYREKCAAIARPFVTRVSEAIEKEKDSTPPKTRESRLRELLWFDPDHAGVRAALGETKRDSDWVLVETVTAVKRRDELAKLAKALVEAPVAFEPAETTPFEDAVGVTWLWKKKAPHLRLIGTVPEKEADRTLKLCEAAVQFTLTSLGIEGGTMPNFTIVACDKPEHGLALARASPDMTDEQRKELGEFHSYLLQSCIFVSWDDVSAERVRESVARTAGSTLSASASVYEIQGAAFEGGMIYVANRVLGTCRPFFATLAAGEEELSRAMWNPKTDWLKQAAKLVESGKAPPLKDLLTKSCFQMSLRESLFSYAFMAFLIEGCPDRAAKFLRVMGRLAPDELAHEVFGVDAAALDQRFCRWLREVR
jgi:hypothetical protein